MIEKIEIQIPLKNDIYCKQCQNILSNTLHIDIYGQVEGKDSIQYLIFIQDGRVNKQVLIPKKKKLSINQSTFLMYLQSIHCAFCDAEVGTLFKTANVNNRFALGKIALFFKDIVFQHVDEQLFLQSSKQQLRMSKQSLNKGDFPCKTDISKYTFSEIKSTLFQAYKRLEQKGNQLLKKAVYLSRQNPL